MVFQIMELMFDWLVRLYKRIWGIGLDWGNVTGRVNQSAPVAPVAPQNGDLSSQKNI